MTPVIAEYVLKVARDCNLACDHCYVYGDPKRGWLRRPSAFSPELARAAATRIAEHAEAHRLPRVTVILHGGEPLLIGAERLATLLATLTSIVDPVTELNIRFQSNGTLLTPVLCDLLARYYVKIGVSLDGDETANDRHRRYEHGGGSYAQVLRGLEVLRRPPHRSLYGGLLCTIDVANDPLAVYGTLVRQRPPRVDFLLPHATWDNPPPGRGYADWLLAIYDQWTSDGRPVPIRMFDSLHSLERGGMSGTESLGADTAGIAVIETDGAWELPDSLKIVSDAAPRTGLDVFSHSVDDFAALLEIPEHGRQLPAECGSCPVRKTCGGGLYAHRYGRGNGFDNPSVYCADLLRLITGIRERSRPTPVSTGAGQPLDHADVELPADHLRELGAGQPRPETLSRLLLSEYALDRRMMIGLARLAGRTLGQRAWNLLADLDERTPSAVRWALSRPYARLRVHLAHSSGRPAACAATLAALAMSAAVAAERPAVLDIPFEEELLCLPGLGVLRLHGAAVATVTYGERPGEISVRPDVGALSALCTDEDRGGWQRIRSGVIRDRRIQLDDTDPFRDCFTYPVADRSSEAAADTWLTSLSEAWESIHCCAPSLAVTVSELISTATPLVRPAIATRGRSASTGHAFGAVALSPADPEMLAEVLVQHAARMIVASTARAFDFVDANWRQAGPGGPEVAALADLCAQVAALRLAVDRIYAGELLGIEEMLAGQDRLHARLDGLKPAARWSEAGRLFLDGVRAGVSGLVPR